MNVAQAGLITANLAAGSDIDFTPGVTLGGNPLTISVNFLPGMDLATDWTALLLWHSTTAL